MTLKLNNKKEYPTEVETKPIQKVKRRNHNLSIFLHFPLHYKDSSKGHRCLRSSAPAQSSTIPSAGAWANYQAGIAKAPSSVPKGGSTGGKGKRKGKGKGKK